MITKYDDLPSGPEEAKAIGIFEEIFSKRINTRDDLKEQILINFAVRNIYYKYRNELNDHFATFGYSISVETIGSQDQCYLRFNKI